MVAVGEAAQLEVLLTLKDQLSGELGVVQTKIAALQGSGAGGLGGLSGAAAKVESAFGKVGGALATAGAKISGFVTGPLALFAGAAGIGALSGAFAKSIETANTMAKAIETLTALTGLDATKVSELLAVFERFGVSTDTATTRLAFMEKTLGALANNTKALTALQKTYGISLTDSAGNIVDVNTALLRLADYMNGSASAADKAKLAATLLGRGYVDLLPVLSQGAAGIAAVEAQAQSLGNTLNQSQVDDLMKYQTAMRDMGEAMQGLELQIAVALVPALTDLARNISSFVATNRTQIVDFFKSAAKFAQDMGAAVERDVVPAIKGIIGAWNSIPGPLKDFLIQAFVVGKVSKFLFNVNIPGELLKLGVTWAAQAVAGLAGDVLRYAFGATTLAAGVEAGAATGAATLAGGVEAGGAAAAAEIGSVEVGGGLIAALGAFAAAVAPLVAALSAFAVLMGIANKVSDLNGTSTQDIIDKANKAKPGTNIGWNLPFGIGANVVPSPIAGYQQPGFFGGAPPMGGYLQDESKAAALSDLRAAQASNQFAAALKTATGWAGSWTNALQKSEQAANKQFQAGKNVGTSADTITKYFQSLSSAYFDPSKTGVGNLTKEIARFKAEAVYEAKHGNKTLADKLNADAAKLQAIKDKITAEGSAANSKLTTIANKPNIVNVATYVALTSRDIAQKYVRVTSYGRVVVT